MILNICNKEFDSREIRDIRITDDRIFIDATDDYYRLAYESENDIIAAKNWIAFKELTQTKLSEAVHTIMMTCEHYINEYEQCEECPLQRDYGCIIQTAPINWQR